MPLESGTALGPYVISAPLGVAASVSMILNRASEMEKQPDLR
jgi:hypothetical protein